MVSDHQELVRSVPPALTLGRTLCGMTPESHRFESQTSLENLSFLEPSCPVGGNASWCGHCGRQDGGSSKIFKNKP